MPFYHFNSDVQLASQVGRHPGGLDARDSIAATTNRDRHLNLLLGRTRCASIARNARKRRERQHRETDDDQESGSVAPERQIGPRFPDERFCFSRQLPLGSTAREEVEGLDGDKPARWLIEAQDRKIAELSGRPRGPIKTIVRSPNQ